MKPQRSCISYFDLFNEEQFGLTLFDCLNFLRSGFVLAKTLPPKRRLDNGVR